jgi:hypothetical protein
VVKDFLDEVSVNPSLKAVLNKRNLKTVSPWLKKMDVFFKRLKTKQPSNIRGLQIDAEKIFCILNISMLKLSSNTSKFAS